MAARLWRCVLGVQAALAIMAGCVFARSLWLGAAIALLVFIALQYLLGLLLIAMSRALAPPAALRGGWLDALRAWLSEPPYFCLAELSMARGGIATPPGPANPHGPLLLVHGLACNSGLWRRLLPRLRAAGFGPIHVVDLEPLQADARSLAGRLVDELTRLHAQQAAPVSVLAHSLGGLTCRAALRELDRRVVRRLVTLGTPHHGAALARLLRAQPVSQMRPDSPWLATLNAGPPPVPVTSIYSLDDNFVTPAASAVLAGAQCHALHGLGHFGLAMSRRATACVLQALEETP